MSRGPLFSLVSVKVNFGGAIAVGDAVNAAGDQGRRHESAGASANHRTLLGRHLTPV